jgi:hypothetical protein
MVKATPPSETSVLARATRRNISEEDIHHSHRRENLKFYYSHKFTGVTINALPEQCPLMSRYRPHVSPFWDGVRLNPFDISAVGGMVGRGKRSNRRKPAPMPLCPEQIQHVVTRDGTRATAVGSRGLIAFVMARPKTPCYIEFQT